MIVVMNFQKMIAGLLVVALFTTLLTPVASAKSETKQNVLVPIDKSLLLIPVEGLSDEELIEIIESEKENFVDPTYGDHLIEKIKSDSSGEFQIQGKFTMTAKAAAKALKKAMKKIGQKSWDGMVKKIEKNFGIKLAQITFSTDVTYASASKKVEGFVCKHFQSTYTRFM